MEEHDWFLVVETSVKDNVTCCTGNISVCVCVVESFLGGVCGPCFIPASSSVQGNHRAWLTFISPPEWSCSSDRLSQFASSCGTHPIRPGHCASCILALRSKLFSSLSLPPSSLSTPTPILLPPTKKMHGYARLIPKAQLSHCQDRFGSMPNLLYWSLFSAHLNGPRQCRFRAEHIKQITRA